MKYSGRQATREGAVGKDPHYNTSCKLVICASLFFYKEIPGYEAASRRYAQNGLYITFKPFSKLNQRATDFYAVWYKAFQILTIRINMNPENYSLIVLGIQFCLM
jgi:hypothetical protein